MAKLRDKPCVCGWRFQGFHLCPGAPVLAKPKPKPPADPEPPARVVARAERPEKPPAPRPTTRAARAERSTGRKNVLEESPNVIDPDGWRPGPGGVLVHPDARVTNERAAAELLATVERWHRAHGRR